jgi:hypothetical protein
MFRSLEGKKPQEAQEAQEKAAPLFVPIKELEV